MKHKYLVPVMLMLVALAGCETKGTLKPEEAMEAAGAEAAKAEDQTRADTARKEAEAAGAAARAARERAAEAMAMEEERKRREAEEAKKFRGHPLDDPESLLSTRVIYFEFDSSEINPEVRKVIEAHAAFLAQNPTAQLTLEGHADERGSREYNIGLGERRASAVQQLMTLQGAGRGQLSTVSYGEERPAAMGHDDDAWRLNRRVELVYTQR